jgi:hypothetical protein
MTWAPLLLADPSPSLRFLVLTELLDKGDSREANELRKSRQSDPLITDIVRLQETDGSWGRSDTSATSPRSDIQVSAQNLTRLGYLGLGPEDTSIRKGAEFLFSVQQDDGSWPLGNYSTDTEGEDNYDVMSLQTSLPLRGLATCGYATDPRAEKAYGWLLNQRIEDGSWPTGIAGGNYGYVAGYRRLPHSRWGCRSNTTSALTCLSLHPERRHSPEARRALDLVLSRETRERHNLGYEVARIIGTEKPSGFLTYYARFDIAHLLDLCWRVGAPPEEARVSALVKYIHENQGAYGVWEYLPKPQASRWVTFDILRSLKRLGQNTDWIPTEPRTPFQPYPKRRKRY